MQPRFCYWLPVLMPLAAANHVRAADGDTYARVCVTNAQGIEVTLDPDGAPQHLAAQDNNYEARINGREAAKIEFCEQNPVLFTYSAGQLQSTPLPDVDAINQFAAAIMNGGSVMAAIAKTAAANTVDSENKTSARAPAAAKKAAACVAVAPQIKSARGIALDSLKNLHTLTDLYGAIAPNIELTHAPKSQALVDGRKEYARHLATVRPMRVLINSLNDYAVARMTAQPISFELQPNGIRSTVHGSLQQYLVTVASEEPECVTAFTSAIEAQLGTWDFAASERDTLAAMLDTLETFSTVFQDVGGDKTAAIVRYDSKNRQSQPLTIAANPTFAKLFSPATKKFVGDASKVGTFKINVEPQLTWRPQIAPGVIYSFVKQPKFSTTANGSGGFTIVQQESDYAAASGMIALNLTHDKYLRENVRPFFQIGISPKKDELAFLLGGGIALDDANKTIVSLGAVYQERDQLAPGLSVGGTLTSVDDLKTDTEFKFGFYLGISYNLLPSK